MNPFNYILTIVICFAGLFLGLAVAVLSTEELKAGKKYFLMIQGILLALMLFFVLEFLKISLVITLITTVIFLLLLFYYKNPYRDIVSYIVFGIMLFLFKNTPIFLILSALVLLYGFPTASIIAEKQLKKGRINVMYLIKDLFINFSWFLLASIILVLLP